MHVLIVYESMFGNTHKVAEAIAEGVLGADAGVVVACLPVGEASPERVDDADLLVVGGPTHMHGMSTGISRRFAAKEADKPAPEPHGPRELDPDAEGPGLRDWFQDVRPEGKGRRAAAFDTRAAGHLAGGAGNGISRRLRRHGYDVVVDPEGFIIDGTEGPLRHGELDRAREWGLWLLTRTSPARGRSGG